VERHFHRVFLGAQRVFWRDHRPSQPKRSDRAST
jgi:hypothetical protein